MPRMAGLLGGTYIVMNRCEHRVQGFGLGGDPNHNTVLYDLTKPVNSRMSAMANTTVARLYHSKAILLLDEQVLGRPASLKTFLLRTLSSFKKSSNSRSLPHHISCLDYPGLPSSWRIQIGLMGSPLHPLSSLAQQQNSRSHFSVLLPALIEIVWPSEQSSLTCLVPEGRALLSRQISMCALLHGSCSSFWIALCRQLVSSCGLVVIRFVLAISPKD
jgi:hypothetical protein